MSLENNESIKPTTNVWLKELLGRSLPAVTSRCAAQSKNPARDFIRVAKLQRRLFPPPPAQRRVTWSDHLEPRQPSDVN